MIAYTLFVQKKLNKTNNIQSDNQQKAMLIHSH